VDVETRVKKGARVAPRAAPDVEELGAGREALGEPLPRK